MGDQISCSYDVINSRYLINQKTALHIGKEVFLLYDRIKNERRKAKIHEISDNIHYIIELKLKLIKQLEEYQINRVQNMSTNTVAEMRNGSVSPDSNQSYIKYRESRSMSEDDTSYDESTDDPEVQNSGDDANFIDNDTDHQSSNASRSPDERRQSELENMDDVPIGSTIVTIPDTIFATIDWNNYSDTTRKLLKAVFPSEILATQTLYGIQSTSLSSHSPDKRLNPLFIRDIILTVTHKCGVSESKVRSCIEQCTSEEKKLRKFKRFITSLDHEDRENIMPSTSNIKRHK